MVWLYVADVPTFTAITHEHLCHISILQVKRCKEYDLF